MASLDFHVTAVSSGPSDASGGAIAASASPSPGTDTAGAHEPTQRQHDAESTAFLASLARLGDAARTTAFGIVALCDVAARYCEAVRRTRIIEHASRRDHE